MHKSLDHLSFEGFGIRASLAHGITDVKGRTVRLKIRGPSTLILELGKRLPRSATKSNLWRPAKGHQLDSAARR